MLQHKNIENFQPFKSWGEGDWYNFVLLVYTISQACFQMRFFLTKHVPNSRQMGLCPRPPRKANSTPQTLSKI